MAPASGAGLICPAWTRGQGSQVRRASGCGATPQPEKGMAVTIVEEARPITCRTAITGGVDTHADTHVAAALDPIGGLLGVAEFPVSPAGYARLLGWLGGFGTVALVGIEGTGSYGAGLARHVTAAGIRVVEVDRSDRQDRRRQGKSDALDAVSAARAAQSGRARGAAAHRRRGPPRAAPLRGGLGAPVRGRPDPRIVGESHPAPAQPPAATGRPIMPCGGSCSPGWVRTRPPAPTLNAAPKKGNP